MLLTAETDFSNVFPDIIYATYLYKQEQQNEKSVFYRKLFIIAERTLEKIGQTSYIALLYQIDCRRTALANSAQARKRARQAIGRRARNMSARSSMRTAIKKLRTALDAGDKETATQAYKEATPVIDKMAGKGLIHKNTAARYKNRLNKSLRAL